MPSLYAKERRQQRDRATLGGCNSFLPEVTVGFGYELWRAVTRLIVLLAIGVVYSVSPLPPTETGRVIALNAVIYACELLLPLIDWPAVGVQPGGSDAVALVRG